MTAPGGVVTLQDFFVLPSAAYLRRHVKKSRNVQSFDSDANASGSEKFRALKSLNKMAGQNGNTAARSGNERQWCLSANRTCMLHFLHCLGCLPKLSADESKNSLFKECFTCWASDACHYQGFAEGT